MHHEALSTPDLGIPWPAPATDFRYPGRELAGQHVTLPRNLSLLIDRQTDHSQVSLRPAVAILQQP